MNKSLTTAYAKGFTLIETFVAITILLIAILGPLSAISRFFADNIYAKNQTIAAFLAQEGLELATNTIYNNQECGKWTGVGCLVDTPAYDDNIKGCIPGPCSVDPLDNPRTFSNSNCTQDGSDGVCLSPLKLDGNNFYRTTSGTDTIFKRGIEIKDISRDPRNCTLNMSEDECPIMLEVTSRVKFASHIFQEATIVKISRVLILKRSGFPSEP